MVDAEDSCGEVEDFCAVEGAGKWQVAAGGVGEAGDHAGAVVDALGGDGGGDTGDTDVAGLQVEAEGAAMLSPVPGPTRAPEWV